jgi:hypothetical protein
MEPSIGSLPLSQFVLANFTEVPLRTLRLKALHRKRTPAHIGGTATESVHALGAQPFSARCSPGNRYSRTSESRYLRNVYRLTIPDYP